MFDLINKLKKKESELISSEKEKDQSKKTRRTEELLETITAFREKKNTIDIYAIILEKYKEIYHADGNISYLNGKIFLNIKYLDENKWGSIKLLEIGFEKKIKEKYSIKENNDKQEREIDNEDDFIDEIYKIIRNLYKIKNRDLNIENIPKEKFEVDVCFKQDFLSLDRVDLSVETSTYDKNMEMGFK